MASEDGEPRALDIHAIGLRPHCKTLGRTPTEREPYVPFDNDVGLPTP